jgi:acetyl-CoA/propionyl-CoA carboxylase, biotin carboxylase, biotin carboxyl carrier protein
VQVLADAHGTVLHLGERECSLQRRHQKVVEEAPSPVVDAAQRAAMGASAVALAAACGYEGAGTVEFIAQGGEFFFLEMNTRLQVEHPVTELVYGVDLVEQQLRVAFGERLALTQAELVPHGHAVEARLYAEDPAAGFLPSTGTVHHYRAPDGPGVRVDAGIRTGSEVGTAYDPMLAKVVAHGADRAEAIRRLDRALASLQVLGVATNAAFSRALLQRDDVRAGEMDTGLLERVLDELATPPPDDLLPAAALAAAGSATPAGPWRRTLVAGEARVHAGVVTVAGRSWHAEMAPKADPHRPVRCGSALGPEGGAEGVERRITLDGVTRRYAVAFDGEDVWIARDGHQLHAQALVVDRSGAAVPEGSLEAPMPGTVLQVRVADGDHVAAGDVLLVLESMKMELAVSAPHGGQVHGLSLAVGDRVDRGQPLVAVTREEDA